MTCRTTLARFQRRVPSVGGAVFAVLLGGVMGAGLAPAAHAEDGGPPGGEIAVRSIGDQVLVRAVLRTEAFHQETHLVIDYAAPDALAVHQNVLPAIQFGEGETRLGVVAEGFRLAIPQAEIRQAQGTLLDELTARYANELENMDVAAIVGWPALRAFAFALDLQAGTLTLRPARDVTPEDAARTAAFVVSDVDATERGAYVPVAYDGGGRGWLAFGTSGYHTFVNAALATRLREPDGGLADIRFGGPDGLPLSGMVALFPQPFTEPDPPPDQAAPPPDDQAAPPPDDQAAPPPDGQAAPPPPAPEPLLLRSGLGLWSAYRLEINPSQGYLALTPVVDSNHSAADAAFYRAAATKDADELRAYAAQWPEDRNIEEAAARIFAIGVETDAGVEAQMAAVALGLRQTPEARRMGYVANFAFPLFGGDDRDKHTALIIALATEALRHVSRAEQPRVRQHLQLMMGDRQLHAGDARGAWKTFLAAAFNGDPRLESLVRHELGRAYEALGRHRRAYASYQRVLAATPPPDLQKQAQEGLARLRPHLADDDPLLASASADG